MTLSLNLNIDNSPAPSGYRNTNDHREISRTGDSELTVDRVSENDCSANYSDRKKTEEYADRPKPRGKTLSVEEIAKLLPSSKTTSGNAQSLITCRDHKCKAVSLIECQGYCLDHFASLYNQGEIDIPSDDDVIKCQRIQSAADIANCKPNNGGFYCEARISRTSGAYGHETSNKMRSHSKAKIDIRHKVKQCISLECTNEGKGIYKGLCTVCYKLLSEINAESITLPKPEVHPAHCRTAPLTTSTRRPRTSHKQYHTAPLHESTVTRKTLSRSQVTQREYDDCYNRPRDFEMPTSKKEQYSRSQDTQNEYRNCCKCPHDFEKPRFDDVIEENSDSFISENPRFDDVIEENTDSSLSENPRLNDVIEENSDSFLSVKPRLNDIIEENSLSLISHPSDSMESTNCALSIGGSDYHFSNDRG